ncbi:MAG: hypothetical protein K2N56_10980 [Oscillospiraceae bacterium]|nr:hypothetical protein [Oscillospiraceae bacterium]
MKIANIEVKRRFRPARIVCDAFSLVMTVVVVVIAAQHFSQVFRILTGLGFLVVLLPPSCAVAICVAYLKLTLKDRKFKRYKITTENAQSVYDQWAFSLSLAKIPLLVAVFNVEFAFKDLTNVEPINLLSVPNILDVLLAVIIIRLMTHRIRALTAVKKARKDDSAIKIKAKIADDDKEK